MLSSLGLCLVSRLPRVAGDVSADCGRSAMTLTRWNRIDKTHLEAMLGARCRKKSMVSIMVVRPWRSGKLSARGYEKAVSLKRCAAVSRKKWTRVTSQVYTPALCPAALCNGPALLLQVSRNLDGPDWPMADKPFQGQRNAAWLVEGAANLHWDILLPITEPSPWQRLFNLRSKARHGVLSSMWNPNRPHR